MAWDEAIFGWIVRKARAFGKARIPEDVLARQVTLASCRDRLQMMACALAERQLSVREAENEGGFAGATLFLPGAMTHAPTPEENADAYVLRVSWSVTALRLNLVVDPTDPLERALATLLAVPATRAAMLERFVGAAARWRAHEAFALAAEPALPERRLARVLAVLWRSRLGGEDLTPSLSAAERAWLSDATDFAPASATELRAALEHLLPGLRALGTGVPAPRVPVLFGWVGMPAPDALTSSAAGHDAEGLPSGTEIEAKPREHVRRVELQKDEAQDNPVVHSFEKVHTAEEHHGGGGRQPDGSDDLADHADALRELDLREVVRTTERASSLLRCDVMIEGAAGDLIDGEAPEGGLPYDEWYERERGYRSGWCTVRPGFVQPRVDAAEARIWLSDLRGRARKHVEAVRAELLRLELTRRWRSRQLEGPEIDEDAVVDRYAALSSGHTGTDRLYRSRPRSAPELAVLLLVDASLSTDGWVQNRRVLDVELEAALVLADALDGLGVELGIASFHSHTRRDCRFDVIKGFSEAWSTAEHRLASVTPAGYTRIGPALRHATRALERTRARRRLLLLITDAKPNDYDRYEGSYGIADVRQAVREAEQIGVHVHALAMDPRARLYLPRMFGPSCHTWVSSPDRLSEAVGRVCMIMRA